MVLSNKKLKQKLRASMAESLTASEAQNGPTHHDSPNPDAKSHNTKLQKSLTSLLGSATRKPRLSKREKRRTNPSLREKRSKSPSFPGPEDVEISGGDLEKGIEKGASEVVIEKEEEEEEERKRKREDAGLESGGGRGGGDLEVGIEEGGSEGVSEKKKKRKERKRKRDEAGLESGGLESVEKVEVKQPMKKKKKKKKKKNKNKKKGKKAENEEMKEGEKIANGGTELGVMEEIKASDSQETVEVATKVYVGGIPYYSTEDDIRSYFEGCGTITEVDCMKFPESGKFRGIAIINFKTDAAAKRALALDGSDMGGLFLKIQPYKSTKANKSSTFAPAIIEGYNRIYAGNLSWDITEDELKKLFSDCTISSIRFGEDKETGEFRGYAHVDFPDSLSLNRALQLDQRIVCGRPVRIRCAVPKKATQSNSKPMTRSEDADIKEVVAAGTEETDIKEVVAADTKEADTCVTSAVSGKIRRRTCYECGEKGHLSSSCPKKQAAELTNSSAT